ncbi:MAG: hypothetical protein WAN10_08050, partial [Candidatus Acidiferrales bacterium]
PTPDDDLLSGKKPPDLKSKKGVLQAASSTLLAMGMQNPNMRRKPKDEAHLDRRLEQIRQVPLAFRPLLDEMLAQLRSTAPGKPRGPKPRLTDRQRRDATNSISTLVANGMSLKYSISKIAQAYQVTPRLMRKVWERRNQT